MVNENKTMIFFRRATKIFRRNGWRKYRLRLANDQRDAAEIENYQKWIAVNRLTADEREKIRAESEKLDHQPLISILVPVYNVEEKWLRAAIESVARQIYANWELCLADDCSTAPHIRRVLEEYASADKRIKIHFRTANGHISAASNTALEMAEGEFAALLDHDDELDETALFWTAKEINDFPEVQMIYSDEDMTDENGARFTPKFKPDFSRDLLYSVNYVTHLAVYKTDVLRTIGGFRVGLEGSQDYDLALRVIERISEKNIRHIPRILYHWRAIQGSVALNGDEKPYAHERARLAIRAHLERLGTSATVSPTVYNLHRVRYDLPVPAPEINVILLAGESLSTTLQTAAALVEKTDYQNLKITVVCSTDKKNLTASSSAANLEIVVCDEAGEAAKYNAAVRQTGGALLCFLNENLLPVDETWLSELAGFALQTEIGAAGAKILDTDEMILHAGLIVGFNSVVGAAHRGYRRGFGGSLGRAQIINNFSAISIDCFVTRRETFLAEGEFDAAHFPNTLFDVDFCLRLSERNLRVVLSPYAELMQSEKRSVLSAERAPSTAETENFKRKWHRRIEKDPFYNPNLSKRDETFRVALHRDRKK